MSEADDIETRQRMAHPYGEIAAQKPAEPKKKPRLVLMGEFSAGKSTLSNLLLGGPMLPTQVTATRLPPVHVSLGDYSAFATTPEGERRAVDLSNLADLTPEAVKSIHLTMQAETLELCDLVDMPGISDPNMASDTWDEILTPNDHVVWCTHATQAWRQSEAALWERLRGSTSGTNLLLITQFDKLRNPRDQSRVLARVQKETDGLFSAVYPVSLLEALEAGENFDAWRACGAHDFMEHLVDILLHRGNTAERLVGAAVTRERVQSRGAHQPEAEVLRPAFDAPASEIAGESAGFEPLYAPEEAKLPENAAPSAGRIVPRRVRARADRTRSERPSRTDAEPMISPPGQEAF